MPNWQLSMDSEKNSSPKDSKRPYSSPQITQFGSVANVTQVNKPATFDDNEFGEVMGEMFPPGLGT